MRLDRLLPNAVAFVHRQLELSQGHSLPTHNPLSPLNSILTDNEEGDG
jgi:hypothetical protein